MTENHKVGYRKPPKHSRFKKGQSGNPRGRPKQKKVDVHLIDQSLKKCLLKKSRVTYNGRQVEMTNIEALLTSILNTAIKKGDAKALKMILEIREQARVDSLEPSSVFAGLGLGSL